MSQSSKWETARLCVHIPISVNHLWDTGIHFLQYKESTSHKKVLWSAWGRRARSEMAWGGLCVSWEGADWGELAQASLSSSAPSVVWDQQRLCWKLLEMQITGPHPRFT